MSKGKRILALDLGSSTFKLVLLEGEGDKLTLMQARLLELPAKSDDISRKEALKELLKGIPIAQLTQIVSVIDDPFATLTQVTVPQMPAGELSGAVKWELQRFLAVPPEEAQVDYELLGEVEVQGVKKLKLLAAAFPGSAIETHLSFLKEAGLQPTQLLPKPAAISAWSKKIRVSEPDAGAILCLGANSSEFLVVRGGELLFSRKIPIAGADFTRGLTAVLMTAQGQVGFTEPEAETIKRTVGIPKEDSPEITAKGITSPQLLALIRGNLERLAVEVERSLAFYGESTAETPLEELLLVGGGAHLKGLVEWLKGRLKMEVRVPDPWAAVSVEPAAVFGTSSTTPLAFVPCLGAALGAGEGINLLPRELKEAAKAELQRAILTGTLTSLLVAAVLLKIGMGISQKTLSMKIGAYQLEKSAVAPELAQAKLALAAWELQRKEPPWEEIFKELSQVVPREIYLTGFSIEERKLTLRGRVRDVGREPDHLLSDFLHALGEGLFHQAQLSSSRKIEGAGNDMEFEIACSLNA